MNEMMNVNTVEIRAVVPIEAVDNALTDSYNNGYAKGVEETNAANAKAAKKAAAVSTIGGLAAIAGIGALAYNVVKAFRARAEARENQSERVDAEADCFVFEEG